MLLPSIPDELRLAERLGIADLFDGLTTLDSRRERLRRACQARGTPGAARAFERLYHCALVADESHHHRE